MTDRHERVESLIRELAAKFIQHEANRDPMITVTRVSTSPDYKRREVLAGAGSLRNGSELRHFIKQKSTLKTIPHLDFEIDYGERHRQHIDEIAREIKES